MTTGCKKSLFFCHLVLICGVITEMIQKVVACLYGSACIFSESGHLVS